MSANFVRSPQSLLESGRSPKSRFSLLEISRERIWFWGTRTGLSLFDQALVSGSSFLLNVLLARWLIKEAYGAFAVCFAVFLFLSGFHNVLVIEPMTVIGTSCYPGRLTEYFGSQLRAHIIIVGPLSCMALVAGAVLAFRSLQNPLASTILALGIGLPFILLLYLVRRMCYVVQNPVVAVQASGAYCLLLLFGAFGLRHLGCFMPATAFLLMAVASLLASAFILLRLAVSAELLSQGNSPSIRQLFHENWGYGRWLVLTTALSWVLVQAQTFLAAGFLELSAAGALRAMQLPSLVLSQLISAAMLLLLPSISQELGRGDLDRLHKKTILSTIVLSAFGLIFVVVLYFLTVPVEHFLFDGKYATSAWLIPVLGLAPVFTGLASSLSLALRTLRKAQFELLSYAISAIAAIIMALILMPRWGLAGAAVSIVGGTATLALAIACCYLKWGHANVQIHQPFS